MSARTIRMIGPLIASAACLAMSGMACGSKNGTGGPPAPLIQVTLSADGCEPAMIRAVAGETRFLVQNPSSSSVNRFELRNGQEVLLSMANVLGGISRGGSVTLEPGAYEMRCSGGGTDGRGEILVSE